jgi:hypothetical protein
VKPAFLVTLTQLKASPENLNPQASITSVKNLVEGAGHQLNSQQSRAACAAIGNALISASDIVG